MKIKVTQDDVELDSPEEALFYGLCRFWEIPVQVTPLGADSVENGDYWYCPGFKVSVSDTTVIYVDVADGEDEDVLRRCREDWRRKFGAGRLAVLYRDELHVMMTRANHAVVREQLRIWAR